MRVPLLDLRAQYRKIKPEIQQAIEDVCESQRFIMGPKVEALESEIAAYCGTDYAVGVSSGTDALIVALMAAGLEPGDRVLTTPYSFFATAGSIVRLGGVPVFLDIDPATYNLSAAKLDDALRRLQSDAATRVKAIMPVHLYGQCAEMTELQRLAAEHELFVIEDAAQAIGAEHNGRRAGALGDCGCFSFFPSKNLGAFGDGGIVTTSDEALAQEMRCLRVHGARPKYYHRQVGGNFRLDALQAAVVSVKLRYLDEWTAGRQHNAVRYAELFDAAGLGDRVQLPVARQRRHIYNQFVIRVADTERHDLRHYLDEAGIGTEIYYPVPLHLQECFAYLGYRAGDLPEAEAAARQTLALPIYAELNEEQLAYVVDTIRAFYDR
jgi:dTDP-4-amino-4,6-dideoxygalactose transaminase